MEKNLLKQGDVDKSDYEQEYAASTPLLGQFRTHDLPEHFRARPRWQKLHYALCAMHVVLLTTSLTLFALAHCMRYRRPSDLLHTQQFSSYSPAAPVVEYNMVRYNITPVTEKTEYVGYGPEVDAAWDRITYDVGDQSLTSEEMDRLGLSRDSLRLKHPQTGKEVYRVGVQVFHQLHCLNLLRQETYRDEYYAGVEGDIMVPHDDLRGHLDHCIEILRTTLMCHADIGVFPFRYYEGFEGHWPDFSTLHMCRNFDDIREWAFENAVAFGNEE